MTVAKYKIPAYFLHDPSFPSLPNGKVDGVNLRKDVIRRVNELRAK